MGRKQRFDFYRTYRFLLEYFFDEHNIVKLAVDNTLREKIVATGRQLLSK